MKNYIRKFGKSVLNGFYSVAEGMSTLTIYPLPTPKLLSDEEAWKKDRDAIASDWKAVGDDLRQAMGIAPKFRKDITNKFS